LTLKPGFAQALINLGLACEKAGQEAQALQHWGQLVNQHLLQDDHDPEMVVLALNHIGRVQENQKRYQLAENALTQSLHLQPDQPHVIQHWAHIRQKACRWPVYQPLSNVNAHAMLMATSPLAMLAMHDDPAVQLLSAQAFVRRSFPLQTEHLAKDRAYRHPRTRIGYVSGDLCVHAVGLLLPELIETHDRAGFEVYAYDFSPEDGSAHRQRLKQAFDHFQSVQHLSDRQVAELILHDEIDVLIDLHGLSSGARPGIFALRPAPLQGTYLGFMGTTGMPWFDFVVADREVLPDNLKPFYAEREVLHVDGSFIPLAWRQSFAGELTRSSMGLAQDAFVMASFGNTYKLNPTLFDAWLGLLRDLPHAVLWLMDDNPDTTRHLKQQALAKGIANDRMVFTPRVSHEKFRAQLCLANVFLDTYPYNCGSTSKDVIDAGVPLVTLRGRTQVSRMGSSMLKSLGLHALVANDWNEYQNTVKRLALGELKVDVRSHAQNHASQAIVRLVRSLERGLRELQPQA